MSAGNQCRAIGCRAQLLPWGLFCDRHWYLIESDVRRLIEKHHRNRRRPSKICQAFIDQAVAELLELQTTGQRRPRDQAFMWSDDEPAPAPDDTLPVE